MSVKMILVSWGSSEHGGGGGSRELHELSLEPRKECHTLIVPESEKKRTVSDCQTEVLPGSVKTKLLSVSITIKSNDRKCHD